jgi:hypothetical protein
MISLWFEVSVTTNKFLTFKRFKRLKPLNDTDALLLKIHCHLQYMLPGRIGNAVYGDE